MTLLEQRLWKLSEPNSRYDGPAHVYRLGFCVTCGVVTRDCPLIINLGGPGSGNFGHGGRPGEIGGSAGEGGSESTGGGEKGGGTATAVMDGPPPEKGPGKALTVAPTAPPKDKPVTLMFGGSFNPPHAGHVKAIEDAVRLMEEQGYKVGKVIVAPTADKLLSKKLGDKMYPLQERTELAKRTFKDKRIEVSSGPGEEAEAETGKLRRTQLADWGKKRNEGTNVVNVTGEDAAPGSPPGFPSIYEGDKGTSHEGYHYLAVPRDESGGGASSTKIRTALKEGTKVPDMTPEAESYLREMLAKNPHIKLAVDTFEESWVLLGGPGSGNFGHGGRPGEVGGSSGEGGAGDSGASSGIMTSGMSRHIEPSPERVAHHAEKLRNDPASSPIEVENAELFGRAEAISEASLLHGDTESRYGQKVGKDRDGKDIIEYHPVRDALHAQAVDDVTADAPRGLAKPKAIILGGLTAAGKSTFVDSLKEHVDMKDYVNINADEMKEKLPEYNGENAIMVHEESSHMAKRATQAAMSNRQNLILDATMGTEGHQEDGGMVGQIKRLKDQGYDVQVMFMDVDVETSVHRSMNRYKTANEQGQDARYVPGRVIRKTADEEYGSKPRKTYEAIKKSGMLSGDGDGYIMIDNRGPSGPASFPPRTAEGRGGGRVVERKGNLVIPSTHLKPAEHGA